MEEWINVKDKLPKLGDEIEAKLQSYGTEHIESGRIEKTTCLFDGKSEFLAFWYFSESDDQYNFAGLNEEQNSTFYIKEWRLTNN